MTDDQPGRLVVTWLPAAGADDAALGELAAAFAGMDVADIRIVRACRSCGSDQHGKPYVLGSGTSPIHVSLSRSAGRVVIGVTDAGPLGVDVEARRAGPTDIVTWVRKESLLKASGHGLAVDPDTVEVTAPEAAPALVVWPSGESLGAPACMFELESPDGFVAAATVLSAARPRLVRTPAGPGG